VYDIVPENCSSFKEKAAIAGSMQDVFGHSELLMLSLPGSKQVEEVIDAFIMYGCKNKDVIDLSTSYPGSTIELAARLKENDSILVDAPLSGGPRNAAEGTLNVMAGGDRAAVEKYRPVLEVISKNIFYTGASGSGNIIKLASNFVSMLHVCISAEIFPFVEKLGVDPNVLLEVLSVSAGNSPALQTVAPKIINDKFDVSFQIKLAFKDLSYLKRLFDEKGIPSLMLDGGFNLHKMSVCKGLENEDISAVSKVIKEFCDERK